MANEQNNAELNAKLVVSAIKIINFVFRYIDCFDYASMPLSASEAIVFEELLEYIEKLLNEQYEDYIHEAKIKNGCLVVTAEPFQD